MVLPVSATMFHSMSAANRNSPVPPVLRVVQQAILGRWRATTEDLYREIVRLTSLKPGSEVVVAGSGGGRVTEWLALRAGIAATGVDPDAESVADAELRARALELDRPIHYETAPLDDLPHETDVFDAGIGEPALSAAVDVARAVSELVRVVKPMGWVVLLQPTWSSEIVEEQRAPIIARLGLRPHLLVEWKHMLRQAGVVEIQVQDWTEGAPGGSGARPVADEIVPLFRWRQKIQIVTGALRRVGWRQARAALALESALLRDLTRERAIGFQLIAGVKWHLQQE